MNHPAFDAPALETMNRLLPAFHFTALLSSNDLSAVYFAKQRSLERDVAIKVLAPHVSEAPEFRQSFESTARTMAKLNHPNLIGVYDSGFVERMLYFVMEFVPGKSLEHSSKGQRVDFNQAVRLAMELCDGLAHAHDHGIVHGDLNPNNILLNQKAEPKIGNFGFTHPAEAASGAEPTQPGGAADPRTDILSVGAILYQLVTGREQTPDAPAPSSIASAAAGLDAVWKQATHPDPARRFPDMRAFHKALDGLLKGSRPATSQAVPASANPAARPPIAAFQTPVQAPPRPKKPAINTGLVVQVLILGGIICATPIIWKKVEQARDRKIQEERDARAKKSAAEKQAFEDDIRRAQEKTRQTQKPAPPVKVTPEPDTGKETPAASLARLRDALAAGSRTEMPAGSVNQGDNDYLLVTEAMSWPEAAAFAEQHGGHLAIPNKTADLAWLVANVSNNDAIWIGAAKTGPRDWALADGTPWSPAKEPGGSGNYLAVDKSGYLRAAGPGQQLQFVIQWHRDGTNPGKIATLLAKTRESLGRATPVFPPGTITLENRRYLFIATPMTWRDAVDLAETSGGHLAVTSEVGEMTGISALAGEFKAADGIWLGGFRKGEQWVWITGEPWKTAKWANEASGDTPDSALILRPGKGWDSRSLSEPASGFIIEWSGDRKAKPAAGGPNIEITTLTTRAKDLIVAADKKRTDQLAANARKVSWDLDIYLRNLSKNDQTIWGNQIALLKNTILNNRVPTSIPVSSGIRLSEKMAKIAQDGAIQQEKIDSDFLVEAERVRIAYINKLREALAQAEKSGQRALAQSISDTLGDTANLADWLRSHDIDPKPQNPTAKPPNRDNSSKQESKNDNPIVE